MSMAGSQVRRSPESDGHGVSSAASVRIGHRGGREGAARCAQNHPIDHGEGRGREARWKGVWGGDQLTKKEIINKHTDKPIPPMLTEI